MGRVKLSVTIPDRNVAALDAYVRSAGLPSRSAAIAEAIRQLGDATLQDAYEAAWQEWAASGDEEAWEFPQQPNQVP